MCSHWCLFTLCCLLWYLNKYFHTNVSYSEILCYTYFANVFHHVWLSLTGLRLVFSSLTLVHFGLRFDVWVFWFSLFDICFAVSPFYIPPKKYFFGVPIAIMKHRFDISLLLILLGILRLEVIESLESNKFYEIKLQQPDSG